MNPPNQSELRTDDIKARIDGLTALLNDAARRYYSEDAESMSDKEYDALLEELKALESEAGYSPEDSPARNIGYETVSALEKVTHKTPMMSLDKTKDENEILEFIGGRDAIVSWKLDGLAVELLYADGALIRAVTRGNGYVGENITHTARAFANLPRKINRRGELRVRGEAVISFSDFERVNAGADVKYKNPRNLCAGTVRQLDGMAAKERGVRFVAHSAADEEGLGFGKKSEVLDYFRGLGFQTVTYRTVTSESFPETLDFFRKSAASQEFATDGLVVSYEDIAYGKSLGATAKFPKDSIAFKWADEEAETSLIDVEWNTSRTGLINPVAVFEPVEIEGTEVERASLHNVSVFESFKLGKGDRITVYKANMIIPQLSGNLTGGGSLKPPSSCPVCGEPASLEIRAETKALYCVNPNCPARAVQTIVHYASRDAMNIEGFSEQTVIKFYELGFLRTYADIYSLPGRAGEIAELKGFGRQSADKLTAAIEKSKDCRLRSFIYGLGIAGVGLVYAKALCDNYGDDIEKITAAPAEDLKLLYGFGEAMANSLRAYFTNPENLALMRTALSFLRLIRDEENGERRLMGKTFVITGELTGYANRKELQTLIEREGGKAAGAVSAKTDYLINNDAASASSKNRKARELGVPVITEEEFKALLQ